MLTMSIQFSALRNQCSTFSQANSDAGGRGAFRLETTVPRPFFLVQARTGEMPAPTSFQQHLGRRAVVASYSRQKAEYASRDDTMCLRFKNRM
jgi:hypothetical protein